MLAYDAAGNRRQATRYESGVAVTEAYTYDTNNRLVSTNKSGNLTSSRTYDATGRVTEQVTYGSPGVVSERRANTYNANGWLTQQEIKNGAGTLTQRITYSAYDALGNVKTYQVQVLTGTAYTNTYNTTYAKFDSYKEQKQAGTSTYFQAGATTSSYDVNGNLTAVSETFATSKNRSFVTDAAGHILQKTENGKTQNYFYANGKPLGSSGALGAADFDFNYTPVSALYPASTPGSYVVSAGDTLRGIALAVFGDAQLWYLIADANGLKTDADLTAGRNLSIPNKVTNLRNAADTFKPYAPGAIIGDTTPTLPDPPPPPPIYSSSGGGGCGGFGAILVAVIAIVAVVMTAGAMLAPAVGAGSVSAGGLSAAWAAGLGGTIGTGSIAAAAGLSTWGVGMIAGAVGSIASQAVGIAVGVQSEFSWSGVAMGAIGGGVSAGLGGTGMNAIARAATSSLITQGIGVATGMQEHFSWAGVAAAGVGAGVAQAVGSSTVFGDNTFARDLTAGLASGVARQVVSGGKANWANVAADAFGNAIANSIIEQTAGRGLSVNSTQNVSLSRDTEDRVQSGETMLDFDDPYLESDGLDASSTRAKRNAASTHIQKTPVDFDTLWDKYPSEKPYIDPKTGKPPVGFENQCAIKVGVALAGSGVNMDGFDGKGIVKIDGIRIPTRAEEFDGWLNKTTIGGIGKGEVISGSDWQDKIKDRTGIVYFENYWARPGETTRVTGDHIDLWNGSRLTASGLAGTATTAARYFGMNSFLPGTSLGFSDLSKSTAIRFYEVRRK